MKLYPLPIWRRKRLPFNHLRSESGFGAALGAKATIHSISRDDARREQEHSEQPHQRRGVGGRNGDGVKPCPEHRRREPHAEDRDRADARQAQRNNPTNRLEE